MNHKRSLKTVQICAAGILGLMMSFVSFAQDFEREARWRSEIEPAVIVGDVVDLAVGTRKVFSIFTEGAQKNVAVVLVHGVGVHPDFGLISKLRTQIAEAGYSTLSVQMPVLAKEITDAQKYEATFPHAAQRLDAAAVWLRAKGFSKIVLASHSMGAWMANVYLEKAAAPVPYVAWACIGITGRIGSTGNFNGPILDLYGENDLKPTLDAAWLRRIKLWTHAGSQRVIVPEANHYFDSKEASATKAIVSFIAEVSR